jgi:hypothetical protein
MILKTKLSSGIKNIINTDVVDSKTNEKVGKITKYDFKTGETEIEVNYTEKEWNKIAVKI